MAMLLIPATVPLTTVPAYHTMTVAPTGMVTNYTNTTSIPPLVEPAKCFTPLIMELNNTGVRVWDVVLLVPNLLFLLFLIVSFPKAKVKLKNTNSPIFRAFYILVVIVAVISVCRCVVSMTVNATASLGIITDKVLWIVLRFFLLGTEMSVVVFGLMFGHLDSRSSIKRVMLVTSFLALVYSVTQGVLEFIIHDSKFDLQDENYSLFGHGGMVFWFTSSCLFSLVYVGICLLPFTPLKERFQLPAKKSFYLYCVALAVLNVTQATGSMLLYCDIWDGLCVVDATTLAYFTCFAPLVYWTFLSEFFGDSRPTSLNFSYKAQEDEQDDVHLPQSYSNLKLPDPAAINYSYDDTQIDTSGSPDVVVTKTNTGSLERWQYISS
ncbi:Transmembrane protein adipocyte-associated 1 [Branchiostoma belcheri]|nr:Transmembrane protein adipocyte-associated 1 [Branchiostoma belcheri]